jgi:outer membrane protein OmpA-like peptidoglycan-associated protein/5-hydroxyisourate hydrolase-like protein (transthyretin family)
MKKFVVFILIIILVSFFSERVSAQHQPQKKGKIKPNPTLILADKHFNNLEYYLAAHEYARVLKNDSSNAYAMFQLAECYRLFYDYKAAEFFYHKVATKFGKIYPLARFWFATMLKDNGNYKKAVENFEKYREEHTDTDLETELYREKASQEIKGCYIAIEEGKLPKKDYGFKCLPKPVNSHESDYSPVVFENDTFLTITSSRRGSVGGHRDNSLGGAFTDVYRFQKEHDTLWNVVKHSHHDEFNKLNTQYNESSGSFTGDEKKYYFTRCDEIVKIDNYEEFNCAIYVSYNKTGKWEKPIRLNENINTPGQWNSQPSISPDGNILFFVSKRPGGLGLHDIWYSTCNGDDQWGPPINLGDKINTLFIDVSPRYYADQKVLFFSSNGHGGHGGLDIFMTKEDDGFQNIINLGYPFNSNRDDFYFVLGEKKGYITSNREGGIGNDDIYSFNIKTKKDMIHKIELPDDTTNTDSIPAYSKESRDEHIADIPRDNDGAQKLAQINGNIIDSLTNAPAANVEVNLVDEHGDVVAKAITNNKGEYTFNNLPNDKPHTVVLKNTDHKNQHYITPTPQVTYSNVAVEPKQELISKINKDNSGIPKTLAVSGVVSDSITKKPAPNTEIQIQDEVGNIILTTTTNDKGEYKFDNLPSNTNMKVVLKNTNPKEKSYLKPKAILKYTPVPEQLESKEVLVTNISKTDMEGKKSFVVKGVITDANGKPVSKGQVHLVDEFGNIVKTVNVDANGNYRIENVAGNKDYKVVYKTTAKPTDQFITTNHKINLIEHESPTMITTKALIATVHKDSLPDAKSITIEGSILVEDTKKPAANAIILLVGEDGTTLKSTVTDKDGNYKFSNLNAPRTYKIILQQGSLKNEQKDKKYISGRINVYGSDQSSTRQLFENIYFDFDSYQLRSEAKKVLDDLYQYCKDDPKIQIELYANTDSYGTSEYNKALSAKRGKAAMDYLIDKGMSQSSMVVNSIGENKSIASNDSELGRQLNRRVEFYILGASNPNISSRAMALVIEPKKTLYSLAKEYNMTVAELKELNGYVGDELVANTVIRVKRRNDDNDIIAPVTRLQAYSKKDEKKYNKMEQELIRKNQDLNKNFDYNNPQYKKYVDSAAIADKKYNVGNNRYEGPNIAYYITQPKNTLYNIARLYGVKVEGLKALNNLTSDTIYIGQKIKIDFNQKDPSITGYVVKEGDTIGEIAKRFGLTINELLDINNLDGYILRKNMILRLRKD